MVYSSPKTTDIGPRQWSSRDFEEEGCTRKLLYLTARKNRHFKGKIALLRVNMKIGCDVERFLYSKLERVWFCNERCITTYLKKTQVLGPLRRTPTIMFFLENVAEAKAHRAGAAAVQSLRLPLKRMHITLGDVGESDDWKVKIEPLNKSAKLLKDGETWSDLKVTLSREEEGERWEVASRKKMGSDV